MIDEPNSRHHHQQEWEADATLPPELAAITARLTTDGALWQSRLPDAARVAERIRAIADDAPRDASTATPLMTRDRVTSTMRRASPHSDGRLQSPSGPWGQVAGLVAAVVVVALLVSVLLRLASLNRSTGPISHPTPTPALPAPTATIPPSTATPSVISVHVYFSKGQASLNDPTLVFPVQRVAPTAIVATVASYAIEQLVAGPTPAEAAAGYFSELSAVLQRGSASNCGGADFTLTLDRRGSTPEPGTVTLQFCRSTSSPGIGADARVSAEITATLRQFAAITKVVILDRSSNCFSDLSGQNRCLK